MHNNDLQRHLESWLQKRYGPRAVLSSKPLDLHAHDFIRATSPDHQTYTWLEVNAPGTDAPTAAGIRPLPTNPNTPARYEFIECRNQQKPRHSYWYFDPHSAWQPMIDI